MIDLKLSTCKSFKIYGLENNVKIEFLCLDIFFKNIFLFFYKLYLLKGDELLKWTPQIIMS